MVAKSRRKRFCSCLGICCMFGPSSSVVSSPRRYQTPRPSLAGTIEPARACRAPGPMEVTTAAFSPVTHRRAARCMGGRCFVPHAVSLQETLPLVDAKHLAHVGRSVPEHAEKPANPLPQETEHDRLGEGDVLESRQGPGTEGLLEPPCFRNSAGPLSTLGKDCVSIDLLGSFPHNVSPLQLDAPTVPIVPDPLGNPNGWPSLIP